MTDTQCDNARDHNPIQTVRASFDSFIAYHHPGTPQNANNATSADLCIAVYSSTLIVLQGIS